MLQYPYFHLWEVGEGGGASWYLIICASWLVMLKALFFPVEKNTCAELLKVETCWQATRNEVASRDIDAV